jgi:hypothetical protein
VAEDTGSIGHSGGQESLHIFGEEPSGSHDSNAICDGVEEPSLVFCSFPLSGVADGLARPAEGQNPSSHERSELLPGESMDIRENRSWVQQSAFSFRAKVGGAKDFPLAVSDAAQISYDSVESKSDTFVSAAKADVRDDGMMTRHDMGLGGWFCATRDGR